MADTHHFVATLNRCGTHREPSQRETLAGLGLSRIGRSVRLKDTPAVRGMLWKVNHLITLERAKGPVPADSSARGRARAARGKS